MKTVTTTTSSRNPARTTGALLEMLREVIEGDGSYVEPGSIDSQGLTLVAGVYRYRLELSEPELLDWHEHTPHGTNYTRGLDFQDEYEEMPF